MHSLVHCPLGLLSHHLVGLSKVGPSFGVPSESPVDPDVLEVLYGCLSSVGAHPSEGAVLGTDNDLLVDSGEGLLKVEEDWADDNLYLLGVELALVDHSRYQLASR